MDASILNNPAAMAGLMANPAAMGVLSAQLVQGQNAIDDNRFTAAGCWYAIPDVAMT